MNFVLYKEICATYKRNIHFKIYNICQKGRKSWVKILTVNKI